jgi:hypothetical protein
MPTSFAKELKQFALSVDIVNEVVLSQVGDLLRDYFKNSLQANTYEVRVPVASGTVGERYLGTLWSCDGQRFTTPLYNDDASVRGHTSYAVLNNKPMWIVAKNKGYLTADGEYKDLWSQVNNLPQYRGWGERQFRTSIIIPFGSPCIGFLNLEFLNYFEPTPNAQEEFKEIAKSIEILYQLCYAHRNQTENTENAVRSINTRVPHSPLLKATLFFAFSSQADLEVIGIVKDILGSYSNNLDIISWDEMQRAGNIHAQMREAILTAEYGICYFSEPDHNSNLFVDNPNVIFEAGMFHALTSSSDGQSRWIPLREERSEAPPFDFAADRLLKIGRKTNGQLNEQAFRSEIKKRLNALLGSYG